MIPITIRYQTGEQLDALLDEIRTKLQADGCAVLKGFVKPEGIELLTAEAESVSDRGYRSYNRTNPYFIKDDPRRAFFDRSNYFILADNFEASGPLRSLHDFAAFDPFIQACLQQPDFYRYADPLADVIINMAEEGKGFPSTSTPTTSRSLWLSRMQSPAAPSNMLQTSGLTAKTSMKCVEFWTALPTKWFIWNWSRGICNCSGGDIRYTVSLL